MSDGIRKFFSLVLVGLLMTAVDATAQSALGDSAPVRDDFTGTEVVPPVDDTVAGATEIDPVAGNVGIVEADTTDTETTVDTADPADAAVGVAGVDSLLTDFADFPSDSLLTDLAASDSVAAAPADSAAVQEKKKDALEDPVIYESTDSMTWMRGGSASLYGNGKVNYQNIELTAAVIRMQIDSSIVYADGIKDSVGEWIGAPVFRDGATPYESAHIGYNFKTEKGYINEIITQQGEGYMTSSEAKKGTEGEYYISDAIYTTCDLHDDPHFNLRITRAKLRPGRDVVFGPAYLEVMGVPLPLFIPFGFFPFTEGDYASGLIVPSYGDELERGFYLKDGGYYFALSDYFDLKVLGEIFTKGSWGLSAESRYKVRYRFTGNLYVSSLTTKLGDKGLPDYSATKSSKIRWTHSQDAKANPYRNFSASVNYATTSYERSNLSSLYNPSLTSQSTRTSSISYSRTFPSIGLSLSSSMNLSQNMRDSTLSVNLPSLSLSLNRIYPFKRKKVAGQERWYEKISFTYSGTLSNSITSKEGEILDKSIIRDWNNGMRHSIPVSATFQILKNINVTPSFNYTSRWYSYKVNQSWDNDRQAVKRDTVYGFNRVYNYNLSVSANTKIYGFYQPTELWRKLFGDKFIMARHVITPTVSYSLSPDFSAARYGFYDTYVYTDQKGEVRTVEYSPYAGSLYGVPGKGKSGSLSMSIGNNLEMKVRSDKDTTGIRKISVIDELGASMSYNFAAITKPWSNLNTRVRLKLTKNYTFSLSATWATYAYEFNEAGRVVVGNRTEYSYGRFGRFQGMSQNWSYTFNNNTLNKWRESWNRLMKREETSDEAAELNPEPNADRSMGPGLSGGGQAKVDEDGYLEYTLPWSFSISYGVSMREDTRAQINEKRMRYPFGFTHSLNMSGNMKLTNKWNINFSSGWDFTYHDFTTTTMSVSRDLHCFNMSCSVVLKPFTSYNFTIRANSNMLADLLKVKKRSSASTYVTWPD